MNEMRCSQCGTVGLEPGFTTDSGQGARGYSRWMAGALKFGPMGGARTMGRPWVPVQAFRCPTCAHLELFAPDTGWPSGPAGPPPPADR